MTTRIVMTFRCWFCDFLEVVEASRVIHDADGFIRNAYWPSAIDFCSNCGEGRCYSEDEEEECLDCVSVEVLHDG